MHLRLITLFVISVALVSPAAETPDQKAPTLDELAANISEAISLHLEGENLAELDLSDDPTILATMELQAVA